MSNKVNIYGAIGYTILKDDNHKILIFSDRHDELADCTGKHIEMNDLLEAISENDDTKVLLEEVDRTSRTNKIILAFPSPHTSALMNTFIKNQDDILGVDIRPFLMRYTLSLYNDKHNDMTLYKYFYEINQFYMLENEILKTKLGDLYSEDKLQNTKIGIHFMYIKQICINFINKNIDNLYKPISKVLTLGMIEEINDILSDIMEWYICAILFKYKDEPALIHVGLAHSTKIIDYLSNFYNYKILDNKGITHIRNLNESNNNGCLLIDKNILDELKTFEKKD
jgi:hypothetical protein